jgi:ribosome maturation factor RimP
MKRTPAKPQKITEEQIQKIEQTVFTALEPRLDPKFYLLAVRFEKEAGYWYLRIYVEGRDFAISLNDCEQISRELDPLMDDMPCLQDLAYSLEVSSPGLFRSLETQREFDFYRGQPVRIEGKPMPKGQRLGPKSQVKPQEGILQAFDEPTRTVTLQKADSSESFTVALGQDLVTYLNPTIKMPDDTEENPDTP